ncbi:carbohydrate ABC transporter permease [Cellulomonas bogoriensis]|uniref:ABC transporter permease n=1 Tax=Cellulomonas bogoriensis 69B4 = DSM 16987 TaxID=1386082 RepID=A0A0A0C1N6_9CELL|nr:sugar ABC transporter permease [Cellulomonas bogoriensis]KGM13264.1 ABC transporter permease [Cellulomonas bogoriensis 69B4 = DSM 16987]
MSTASGRAATDVATAPPGESPGSPAPRKTPTWSERWGRFDHKVVPYLLISPFFILFAVFGLFPLAFNGVVAFRRWSLRNPAADGWAGFDQFTRLIGDDRFWNALGNTFGIFFLSTVPQLFMALIIASLLNRRLRAQSFFRVGILLPYVTPIVASTLVFSQVFGRDYGLANWVLGFLGVTTELGGGIIIDGVDWRATKLTSWIAIALMVNWKWIGYNALLYLAAMQSIPKDVYEAAALDGAGAWTQLWKITVPMIRPMVLFTVVISTINGLQLFTEPMLFDTNPQSASGGTRGQFQTVGVLIYQTGWKNGNLGYAAAMSWALFLIIVVLASFNAFLANKLGGGKR